MINSTAPVQNARIVAQMIQGIKPAALTAGLTMVKGLRFRMANPEGVKVSAVMAHYLGELVRLGGETRPVSPTAWAEAAGVSLPAASRMASRLAKLGLIERSRGVRLTEFGRREGLRAVRAHRLSEAFLVRVLGYGWHEAHDTADRLGEIADDNLIRRMDAAAGYPTRCPHGEPIPDADGHVALLNDHPLTDLAAGDRANVSRVRVRDADRLMYLADIGLVPQATLRIEGRGPFRGPLRLTVGAGECVVAFELAERVWVDKVGNESPG